MRILIISVALLFGFANTSGNLAYANQAQSTTREHAPSREQIDALIKASCIEQHLNQIPTALKQSARQSGPASAFVDHDGEFAQCFQFGVGDRAAIA